MRVGKAKRGFKARKDTNGDSGCFHRGKGGHRARKAIETRVRQAGKTACRQEAL